jgi:hypothetical protein
MAERLTMAGLRIQTSPMSAGQVYRPLSVVGLYTETAAQSQFQVVHLAIVVFVVIAAEV